MQKLCIYSLWINWYDYWGLKISILSSLNIYIKTTISPQKNMHVLIIYVKLLSSWFPHMNVICQYFKHYLTPCNKSLTSSHFISFSLLQGIRPKLNLFKFDGSQKLCLLHSQHTILRKKTNQFIINFVYHYCL